MRRRRIHIHGMFVFGFDEDDWRTVRRDRALRQAGAPDLQPVPDPHPAARFGLLRHGLKAEQRIRFHDWDLYDAHHAVFQPARFLAPRGPPKGPELRPPPSSTRSGEEARKLAGRPVDRRGHRPLRPESSTRLRKKRNRTFLRVAALLKPRPGSGPGHGGLPRGRQPRGSLNGLLPPHPYQLE
ncbi:MAG: hypothetical protein MZU79_04695 [Anaerotruncus sp.]|nr:hypothetical protein [Anaerotruncus sp.]